MTDLVIATTASAMPMGAQAYQAAIVSRAEEALREHAPGPWTVRPDVARSLRSPLPGNRRLPMGRLLTAGPRERRLLGQAVWSKRAVVHRMDLVLPPPPGPDVVTLHDVVAWKFADEADPVRAAAAELRRADAVISVSEFTAGEAQELLGLTNVTVIPNGVAREFFDPRPLSEDELAAVGLRGPFVLYSGGSAARKNLGGLAAAWSAVHDRLPEVTLALSGPRSEGRDRLFAGLPRVAHLGRLPDPLMPGLMAAATAVVVPSVYEGFGLPALEAMAVGVPLLSSNASSLPEVVGDGGTLVDPRPEALAAGLEHVVAGGEGVAAAVVKGLARSRGYTWDASVQRHAQVWASLA